EGEEAVNVEAVMNTMRGNSEKARKLVEVLVGETYGALVKGDLKGVHALEGTVANSIMTEAGVRSKEALDKL
ncbi:hypothetical protein HDV05_000352, partial [Chytridiales sp. JEL 0842]